jgi:hypothetical protein
LDPRGAAAPPDPENTAWHRRASPAIGYGALYVSDHIAVRMGCEKLLRATYPDLAQFQEFMDAGIRSCFVVAKTKATGKVPE